MKRAKKTPTPLSVRTKLLVMLAVLSLPLLIISLTQLSSYRRNLTEQAKNGALLETAAAAATLASWLKDFPIEAAQSEAMTPAAVSLLHQNLHEQEWPTPGTLAVVFDQEGRPVQEDLGAPDPLPVLSVLTSEVAPLKWSDGSIRLTAGKRIEPYGWSVAVGVPLPENTPAGRSALMLTVTWALTLLASTLLGVWAVGRFTTPLRQLASSVSTFGEGKLHERAAVQTSDEVGTMATSFNAMAASLQSKFNEVQTQGAFIEEVLDGLPLGVVVLDAQLTVRKANPTFASFVERDAASLAGRGIYEAAAGLAILSDVIEDVRRTRLPFITYGLPLEMSAREDGDADASKFWDITIWPTSARSAARGDLLLILSEVSKRVRAERLATTAFGAEKSRNAELESVINQMNEGVVIVDRQNRYRINPMAARIMGREPCEFRDGVHALIDDMHLRDAEGRELKPGETPLGRALEHGERVSGEQLRMLRGDGEERVVAVSAAPLLGEDNRREGMVAVFRDITEDVRQHNELVAAYDRLREHDRLKSAFIISVTHELRTPLNVIIGLCQTLGLDREHRLAPLQSESVVRMERNARSLLMLVNDLLDYSRLEAGRSALHLESVDVGQVVRQVAEGYAAEARNKKLELRVEVASELGYVTTDRQKLSKVLTNLVNNAVKFTSAGRVSIVAAPFDDEHWYVEVSDTGIGIATEALTYIFDEFRQVDDRLARVYSGVGLGLTLTRKIVELLAGEITVESKPNSGSRFRIVWPHNMQLRTGTGSLVTTSALTATPGLRARTG